MPVKMQIPPAAPFRNGSCQRHSKTKIFQEKTWRQKQGNQPIWTGKEKKYKSNGDQHLSWRVFSIVQDDLQPRWWEKTRNNPSTRSGATKALSTKNGQLIQLLDFFKMMWPTKPIHLASLASLLWGNGPQNLLLEACDHGHLADLTSPTNRIRSLEAR